MSAASLPALAKTQGRGTHSVESGEEKRKRLGHPPTAVVGDLRGLDPGQAGVASVFAPSGTTWSQQAELLASDGAPKGFGTSVAVAGNTILVGSPDLKAGEGSADVFGSSGPLYTLSAAPNSLSVQTEGQATSTITITPFNGFSGSVSLSASGLPNWLTAVFNPNPATSDSTLTLTASAAAYTTIETVPLIGTSGSLAQTTRLTLSVTEIPIVSLSPASRSFSQAVNTTSVAKSATLTNAGEADVEISSIAIQPGAGLFTISSNTCGATLHAGKKCKVSVTFTPTALGKVTATLSFTDNATGSPQTVSLTGTGVLQAKLTPASYTFPKTKVGSTSIAHNFTLQNNLSTTLTDISYSTAAPFAVSTSTCGTTLNSKASCTISVTFSPTQTGKTTGTLTLSDSANNSPQMATLTGTGD